jgi:tetratricopeptide (TPR) repeat protein
MVRSPIAVLFVAAVLCLNAEAATPEASLELGMRAFRAGDYASARVDLEAAAAAVPPSELPTDVAAGQMDRLQSFETALVYLALAQFRLGGEDESRQTIVRLLDAEHIAPVYATLPLQSDAAEFETLVAALVPDANLVTARTLPLPTVKPAPRQEAIAPPIATPPASLPAPKPVPSATVREALNRLRQAEALADQGDVQESADLFARLAASEPREIVAAAAVGLYRTGAYREATQAFSRLGALGRGEEDLHYYYAVSLYESGDYEAARRELMCALPYIEWTDEVARYRIKIEQALISRL